LAGCIDRGLSHIEDALSQVRNYVDEVRAVAATLDPSRGGSAQRETQFTVLRERLQGSQDPIHAQMAGVMTSFQPGLFAGGEVLDLPQDNLDLERWFRHPPL
jgi:hypothetical protein